MRESLEKGFSSFNLCKYDVKEYYKKPQDDSLNALFSSHL